MNPAREERQRLVETLTEVGPDAPTLCEGWTTRTLAAHVVVRERRPDAALGLVVPFLSGHLDQVTAQAAERSWEELLSQIESGPPKWSITRVDPVDVAANSVELFVHHEDVRRATEPWEPRELDPELLSGLERGFGRGARMLIRKAPVKVSLVPEGASSTAPVTAGGKGDDEIAVTVTGPVPELVLWAFGRQASARVSYDGKDEDVELVRSASFGI